MTVSPLDWFPKMFSPGDIDGEGARKLLGRPSLHPLATLVRETAQNSWDATLPGRELTFEMNVRTLEPHQHGLLARTVFAQPGRGTRLAGALAGPAIAVLEIHDRGTSGLGGPLRNDIPVPDGVSTDFIDFIFNIGAPRDTELGGGTYGFGKTISYLVSEVDTIIVWSHTGDGAGEGARLIASAVGDTFDFNERRYTGRQWWGRIPPAGPSVLPLLGVEADEIGRALFSRGFDEGETGTSIMILDISLPEETGLVAEILAEAVMWNLWPKLLAHNDVRAMRAAVLLDGRPVRQLDPTQDPRLIPFVASMAAIRDVQAGESPSGSGFTTVRDIDILNPRAHLGHTALSWHLSPPETIDDPLAELGDTTGIRPFEGTAHHVALMRQAELVVRYIEGPAPQLDRVGYGGVFRCLPGVDDAFAAAEPPAHDDWEPAGMENRVERSYVNVGLRRVRETMTDFVIGSTKKSSTARDDTPQRIAARVAADLADLVDHAIEQPLAGRSSSAPGRRRGSGGPALTTGQPRVVTESGVGVARVPLQIAFASPVRVICHVGIGYEGGSESDPDGPICRGYEGGSRSAAPGSTGERLWVEGRTLDLKPGDQTDWTAVIELPPDLTADLDFEIAVI